MIAFIIAAAVMMAPSAPEAAEVTSTTKWVAHWGDHSCWLIRSGELPAGSVLAIRRTPGNDTTQIMIVDPAWKKSALKDPEHLAFILSPEGEALVGETRFIPNDPYLRQTALDRARISFSSYERSLDARLAAATSISVRSQGVEVARANLPTMKRALQALRSCEADALGAWGMDSHTFAALRSGPRPLEDGPPVITDADYPSKLIRDQTGGKVVIRLSIDAAGKPSDCKVLETSGQELLDRTSCALFVKRARFRPATDAAGNPVAADYVNTVAWWITSAF